MHSHSYRVPEPFTNQTVLIIGGGPSGIDISYDLASFVNQVNFFLSCHFQYIFSVDQMQNLFLYYYKIYKELCNTLNLFMTINLLYLKIHKGFNLLKLRFTLK